MELENDSSLTYFDLKMEIIGTLVHVVLSISQTLLHKHFSDALVNEERKVTHIETNMENINIIVI